MQLTVFKEFKKSASFCKIAKHFRRCIFHFAEVDRKNGTILYGTILYGTVLYYMVLYYTVRYGTILYGTIRGILVHFSDGLPYKVVPY